MTIEQLIEKYTNKATSNDIYGDRTESRIYTSILKDLENIDFVENKILIVEDGSIDLDEEKEILNKMGYHIVVYRQGANKPEILGE